MSTTTTENGELTIVAAAIATGAAAASLATATPQLPASLQPIAVTISVTLGVIATGLTAFWKAKVNKTIPTA